MKWTGTILIPKIQKTIEGVQEDLNTVLNGYDPQGDKFRSAMIDWDSRTDYDEKDALEMIKNTQRDFLDNFKNLVEKGMVVNEETIGCAHRMDLYDNFSSNWLIGWVRGDIAMMSEFVPLYNERELKEYLEHWGHDGEGVYSVPVYYHA